MKRFTSPADRRRAADLGYSNAGPHDVATLRRLLAESAEREDRLRTALAGVDSVARDPAMTDGDRLQAIVMIAEAALRRNEEG